MNHNRPARWLAPLFLLIPAVIAGCVASDAEVSPAVVADAPIFEPFDAAMPAPLIEIGEVPEKPWKFTVYDGWLLNTPNYDIHTTITSERIRERLPTFFESALGQYRTAITPLPPPTYPMDSFIFADRRQWEAKTREILPQQADQLGNLGRGGFATRGVSVLYYIDWRGRTRDTFAIASHEGWHQYTQSVFRNALPVWLEEAIATYMEGHRWGYEETPSFDPYRNSERRRTLARARARDRLIPFDDLIGKRPQEFLTSGKSDLLTYYAQVWALALFLIDGEDGKYRPALERMLTDAARGQLNPRLLRSSHVVQAGARSDVVRRHVGPWALYEYFDHDIETFKASYDEFVAELVKSPRTWWRRGS